MAPTVQLLVSVSALLACDARRLKFSERLRYAATEGQSPQGNRVQLGTQRDKTTWHKASSNQYESKLTMFGEPSHRSGRHKVKGQRNLFRGKVANPVNYINDPRCSQYEMCQCSLGPDTGVFTEKNTQCMENSCVYQPLAPFYCRRGKASCSWGAAKKTVKWAHCEWANTMSTEFYPGGDHIFVNVRTPVHPISSVTDQLRGNLVLVDIDDTIICSGGVTHGGTLEDCAGAGAEKKGILPGAVAFFFALTMGTNPFNSQPDGTNNGNSNKLRFPIPMTARPRELKLILGLDNSVSSLTGSGRAMREAFIAEGPKYWKLDTANAKYGKIRDILDMTAVIGHRGTDATEYDQMGYRKFASYKYLYDKKYTDFGIQGSFFVGDNGQGDLIAAQMMLSYGEPTKKGLRAAFIHDAARMCGDLCRQEWKKYNIFVFNDYPQAASIACDHGFITAAARDNVCKKADDLVKGGKDGKGFPCNSDRPDGSPHLKVDGPASQ